MDSLFKTIRLRGTAVNFFIPRTKAVAARALIAFDGQYLSVLDWDKQDVRHSFLNSHSPALSCYNHYAIGGGFRSRRNGFRGGGFVWCRNRRLRRRLRCPPALQERNSEQDGGHNQSPAKGAIIAANEAGQRHDTDDAASNKQTFSFHAGSPFYGSITR